jgi:hypothetical protein
MSDDLIARAKAASEGFVVPESWGEAVELEEGGGVFIGRYRGVESSSRGPVYLFWDEGQQPRFFWPAYRLKLGMDRESPSLGDTVCVYRDANYETQYDDPGEASGLAYGVAVESNDAPLPETPATGDEPAADDDLPF